MNTLNQIIQKIDANDRSINDILDSKKYTIEFFQREYKWEKRQIEELLSDLETAFLNNYKPEHSRQEVKHYNSYYLGPVVFYHSGTLISIIDGQQRITSLTLLLIYLNHLKRQTNLDIKLDSLIYADDFGTLSFNLQDEDRRICLESLYNNGNYSTKEEDSETVRNLAERYTDIEELFSEELKEGALPYFIDWLKHKVVLVEIIAYSEDNAYTIFETMNDRGLNLSATEMLKGYILSKISDIQKRNELNIIWKEAIQKLNQDIGKDEDLRFFQSWLRAKYAVTIRQGKAGATNEDFEKIGTRFHTWVKDSQNKIGIHSSQDFYDFIKKEFTFYNKIYHQIYTAKKKYDSQLPYLYYVNCYGIANSLLDPLLMAPLHSDDSQEVITKKLNLVAKYVEIYVVSRSVNFKTISQSSIRYTIYSLVKEIRNKTVEELAAIIKEKIRNFDYTLQSGFAFFRLHGMNYHFTKYLLCRMTSYLEQQTGKDSTFNTYYNPEGKRFEVEHIWANNFEEHRDEFEQQHEFNEIRNRLGDLLLLPNGSNQSYNDMPYEQKYEHYIRENALAQTLHPGFYVNNPNFLNNPNLQNMGFKPYTSFKKSDIAERQELYLKICEDIWSLESFTNEM